MTTLDQVRLLEEKVEGAVSTIQQLQAENDALRKKCTELTNALSSKTEQLSTFSNDKTEIEDGIKKALDRLSLIENSVIKAGLTTKENDQVAKPSTTPTSAPIRQEVKKEVEIEKKAAPASIQITPGVSKINEEELHKVQQRTPINSQIIGEQRAAKPTVTSNFMPNHEQINNSSYSNIETDMEEDSSLSFDSMELSSQYDDDSMVDDNTYDLNSTQSFDDMGLDNSFNTFNEEPSPSSIPQMNKPKDNKNQVIY